MRTDGGHMPGAAGEGHIDRDPEIRTLLEHLDPATRDPNYWFRFREWVVRAAGPELARRRLVARLTVSDVLNSWARMLVPAAVVAAAVAATVLLRVPVPTGPLPVGVEELLVSDVVGATIPTTLGEHGDAESPVTFAMEIF